MGWSGNTEEIPTSPEDPIEIWLNLQYEEDRLTPEDVATEEMARWPDPVSPGGFATPFVTDGGVTFRGELIRVW